MTIAKEIGMRGSRDVRSRSGWPIGSAGGIRWTYEFGVDTGPVSKIPLSYVKWSYSMSARLRIVLMSLIDWQRIEHVQYCGFSNVY